MKNNQARRLQELEVAAGPKGRIRWLFRWSSQDQDEAMLRWKESLEARGAPLMPGDEVWCLIWNDEGRACADDWSILRAPSYPSESRFEGAHNDAT